MNFALALAGNKLRTSRSRSRVAVVLSESTRATVAKATTGPQAIALTLGSPEFQSEEISR